MKTTKAYRRKLAHYYRQARAHQLATYGNSGLWLPYAKNALGMDLFRDARQFVGGGAAYGCHAQAAYCSARQQIHFRKRVAAQRRKR